MDPVVWWQARIAGLQRILHTYQGIPGEKANQKRCKARSDLKRAQQALERDRAKAAAGDLDRRGLAQRKRDRRDRKARERGGTSLLAQDVDARQGGLHVGLDIGHTHGRYARHAADSWLGMAGAGRGDRQQSDACKDTGKDHELLSEGQVGEAIFYRR